MPDLIDRLRTKLSLPPPETCRLIREMAGASQLDVAGELGVSQKTVSHWESGATKPRGEHLGAYVELLQQLRDVAI